MPLPPAPMLRAVVGLLTGALLLVGCGADDAADPPEATPSTSAAGSPSASASEPPAGDGTQYVALGDSYTAAPLVPPTDTADGCLQSGGNYPHLVAEELGWELTDVSCVGATSTSMIGVQQTQDGATRPPQFEALSRQTDVVTLGIGGNDVGLFTTLLQQCFPLAEEDPDGAPCTEALEGTPQDLLPAVRALDDRIEAIVAGIRDRAPNAEVVVVTYPQLLPEEGTCPEAPLADGDYAYVREVGDALSRSIAAGARAADAQVVDVLELSEDHDVCADEPWVNGAETDPEQALAFHPFAVEQEAVAAEVVELVGG